ncbi:acyl carrier protein [Streptomyces sp. NPDC020379]|uniref:acyl carrier protein n=1 Tax=Streptomyces sp. NPDC020379 TaxID=3365071 RepID=UPI00378E7744
MTLLAPSLNGPRFSHVVPPPIAGTDYRLEELLARLAGAPPDEALRLLEEALTSMVADTLHMPVEQISSTTPLKDYGMDSLMAMEVMNKVRKHFQREVPAMELLHSDGSIQGISEILLPRLLADPPPGRTSAPAATLPHPRHEDEPVGSPGEEEESRSAAAPAGDAGHRAKVHSE